MESEITRILAQIEAEMQAIQYARAAYTITSNHAFITRRMEMVADHKRELDLLLGEDQATQLFLEQLERTEEKGACFEHGEGEQRRPLV